MASIRDPKLPDDPRVQDALICFFLIKKKILDGIVTGTKPAITGSIKLQAYTKIYELMLAQRCNDYEKIQASLRRVYKESLSEVANLCFCSAQDLQDHSLEQNLRFHLERVYKFTQFAHLIRSIFNPINTAENLVIMEALLTLTTAISQTFLPSFLRLILEAMELFHRKEYPNERLIKESVRLICMFCIPRKNKIQLEKVDTVENRFQFRDKNIPDTSCYMETSLFQKYFTKPVAEKLKEYYAYKLIEYREMPIIQYLTTVEEELNRIKAMLTAFCPVEMIINQILNQIKEILIDQEITKIMTSEEKGVDQILRKHDVPALIQILRILDKSSKLSVFFQKFRAYIRNQTELILPQPKIQQGQIGKSKPLLKFENFEQIVDKIYDLKQRVSSLTQQLRTINENVSFAQSEEFIFFLNKTDIPKQLLVNYLDKKLSEKEQQQKLKECIQKVCSILKHLSEFEGFMKAYQKNLKNRILYHQFKNMVAEKYFLDKIKEQAGISSITKCTDMIKDMEHFTLLDAKFKARPGQGQPFVLEVMKLNNDSWLINDVKNDIDSLPPILRGAVDSYKDFYEKQFKDQNLIWALSLGRGIIEFTFNDNVKHQLLVNTYQMLFLFFLESKQYQPCTVSEAIVKMKISDEYTFRQSLIQMEKVGVLLKEGTPNKIESDNEKFQVNMSFKGKKHKFICFQPVRNEEKHVNETITKQRFFTVQAHIIRIMKNKKRCEMKDLYAEVLKKCLIFNVEVTYIKGVTEECIRKEYLQVDKNNTSTLIYLP